MRKIFLVAKVLIIVALGYMSFCKALENQKLRSEHSKLKESFGGVIVSDPNQAYLSSAGSNQSGGIEIKPSLPVQARLPLTHDSQREPVFGRLRWQIYCPKGVAIRASQYSCYPGEVRGRDCSFDIQNAPIKPKTLEFVCLPHFVCVYYRGQVRKFLKDHWEELERISFEFDGRTPVDLSKTIVLFELRVPNHLQSKFENAIDEELAHASRAGYGPLALPKNDNAGTPGWNLKNEALWHKQLLSKGPIFRFEVKKISETTAGTTRNNRKIRNDAFQEWLNSQ